MCVVATFQTLPCIVIAQISRLQIHCAFCLIAIHSFYLVDRGVVAPAAGNFEFLNRPDSFPEGLR